VIDIRSGYLNAGLYSTCKCVIRSGYPSAGLYISVYSSVADPNPDPHVFGPLGSGSGSFSQKYGSGSGSGSFYH
jgi:hypothetical protein